ncbi:MAG: tetratricopeptide repeat-containing protein [Blastocatellales bacterium]
MRAFIIRPFGKKESADKVEINFDEVERLLINPALEKLRISGRTTVEIMRAGNIREDMFNRLLTADIAIADITLHNPNVFYELGIRHAFRDKYTILLRSKASPVPFDLLTDRYLEYRHDNPADSIDELVNVLQQSLGAEKTDSPVFQYLPHLKPEDKGLFLAVPREFREAVERAKGKKQRGDLRLLAAEAEGFVWETEGLRIVARALDEIDSLHGAKKTWESIQSIVPDDLETNLALSSIYERLDDFSQSEQALNRVFKLKTLSRERLSEVHALHGDLLRAEWAQSWRNLTDPDQIKKNALRSPLLGRAFQAYWKAFRLDLNNYDATINALALLIVETSLANELPDLWKGLHEDGDEDTAEFELKKRLKQIVQLKSTAALALDAERQRLDSENNTDFWFESSEAALLCLTSESTDRITQQYADAIAVSPAYAREVMRNLLLTFKKLQVRPGSVTAALEAFSRYDAEKTGETRSLESVNNRILLFAGHRADSGYITDENMDKVRAEIAEAVRKEAELGNIIAGLAGGSNGGDLLFHEACTQLNIPSRLFIPSAIESYAGKYVAPGGAHWIEKFRSIYDTTRRERRLYILDELDAHDELPHWLQEKSGYNTRRRNHVWMLHHALAISDEITMIVLWDGKPSDGKGDIADIVDVAVSHGLKVVRIPIDRTEKYGVPPSGGQ